MCENAKLAVGDRLWLVLRNGRGTRGSDVMVTKVGRKWASIVDAENPMWDRPRINLNSLECDGGESSSPGRCFRSRAEYEERLALAEGWEELRQIFGTTYRRPAHLTVDDMKAIRGFIYRKSPSA